MYMCMYVVCCVVFVVSVRVRQCVLCVKKKKFESLFLVSVYAFYHFSQVDEFFFNGADIGKIQALDVAIKKSGLASAWHLDEVRKAAYLY